MSFELNDVVYEYIEHRGFATPKSILLGVSPIFKNYDMDTLKRKITRSLNSLLAEEKIKKYPLGSIYYPSTLYAEDEIEFDLKISLYKDWSSIEEALEKPLPILVCSGPDGGEYESFAEYYLKKKEVSK